MVRIAVADVGEIVDVLHIDDQSVPPRVMDGSRLQEGDVLEGRSVLPGNIQLVLLVNLCFL